MQPDNTLKYAKTLRTMLDGGYSRDKALAALKQAFALTTEQVDFLNRKVK